MEKVIPKLRFPEFKGNWEEKSVSELGTFIGGGTPDSSNEKYWKGTIPWISSSDLKDNNIHEISMTRYINEEAIENSATKLIPKNTVLMVSRVGIGKFAVSKTDLCTSQDFTNLKTNHNSIFIANYFNARSNRFIKLSQGTSIQGFTTKDLKSAKFNIPSLPEQQKIASFLTSVDERLTLLAQQKEKLELYKKGVMQQIFSQKLRFKDEKGNTYPDWEEKKLGEIGEIITGKTPSTNDKDLWNGNVDFITPTDIIEGSKYQHIVVRKVKETPKMKILPKGAIVYTCIASIGKMSLTVNPAITNQQINSILPLKKYNNEFVYYSLLNLTPKIKATQANTTLPIINKTDFSKFKIGIPCLEEQQKIASFLSAIDIQIEGVSKKIAQTKMFKKGLLQQMFV